MLIIVGESSNSRLETLSFSKFLLGEALSALREEVSCHPDMWDHLRSQSGLDLVLIAYSCQRSYLGFIMSSTYPIFESILPIFSMFYVHPSWRYRRIYLTSRCRSRLSIGRSRCCASKLFLGSKSTRRIMASSKLPGKEKRICVTDIHISYIRYEFYFRGRKFLSGGEL